MQSFNVFIAVAPHCYLGYVIENPDICATGKTYDDCLINLYETIDIWQTEEYNYNLNQLLIKNNINPIE